MTETPRPLRRPVRVNAEEVPWRTPQEAPTRVRIKRLITRERHGSDLMLGVALLDPGEQTNRWSSMAENDAGPDDHWYGPVDEVYYGLEGRLVLAWENGMEAGEIAFGAGDAVYLAPGHHYRLRNEGPTPARIVYAMVPAQE